MHVCMYIHAPFLRRRTSQIDMYVYPCMYVCMYVHRSSNGRRRIDLHTYLSYNHTNMYGCMYVCVSETTYNAVATGGASIYSYCTRTFTHTYMYAYTHAYAHTYAYLFRGDVQRSRPGGLAQRQVRTLSYQSFQRERLPTLRTHVRTCIHTHIHRLRHTYRCGFTDTYIHACRHICMRTYRHSYTYIRAYTHA